MPFALLLFLLVAFGLWVLLEHTTLGKSIYLLGSNEEATRYSGVNTARVQITVYVVSALLSWAAALLMMSMFNSAKSRLRRITAVNHYSGIGAGRRESGRRIWRVIGMVMALVVLQMLESGLNLLGVSSYLTMALWGGVLILFIALQNRRT